MKRITRILLLSFVLTALAGCTLGFGGPEEAALPVFSGAPTVRITAPLTNATYLVGVAVNIQVQVTNAGPDIDRVEISVEGERIGTLPQPNPTGAAAFGVTQTFTPEATGTYAISAVAYRGDGTISPAAGVTINVVDELPTRDAATSTPAATNTSIASPTSAVSATATLQPAATSTVSILPTQPTAQATTGLTINPTAQGSPAATIASAAGSTAVAKFEGVVNVRRGPSTNFEPPLGTFQAGQQANILAQNNEGTWYKVSFAGGEGWVFAQIVTTEGDLTTVPRESGPPIPTARPAINTPIPQAVQPTQPPAQPGDPTAPPASGDGPNLVVVNWEMRVVGESRPPNDIAANKDAIAFVRVRNTGNQPSGGFFAVLTIVNGADSGAKIVEAGASSGLQPGQEEVIQIDFNENVAPAGTGRVAVVRLDENNQVSEANEGDNASSPISYTLAAN